MTIVENLRDKIEGIKRDKEKMYAGVQFENQLNEKMKDLELLEQEIDKVLQHKEK